MPGEGGPVLQLGGEELQATGSRGYRLAWCGQAHHAALGAVWSVALPPHVHGMALRPLLGGEGGGVAQAIVIRLVWGRQSVSGRYSCSSWIQEFWSRGIFWRTENDAEMINDDSLMLECERDSKRTWCQGFMSGFVSGRRVQSAALHADVAAATRGGAVPGPIAVTRGGAARWGWRTRRGIEVQTAGREEAGSGSRPCCCVRVRLVWVETRIAEVSYRFGIAQGAVAL